MDYGNNNMMSRPIFLYICSNAPYMFIPFIALVFCLVAIVTVIDVALGLGLDFNFFLTYVFEPILIFMLIITVLLSLFAYIFFIFDLKNNSQPKGVDKKNLIRKFIFFGPFVNSFYYDLKYPPNLDNQFFLENFIKKSREKMFGEL